MAASQKYPARVQIIDRDQFYIRIDEITKTLTTISLQHDMVHEGKEYFITDSITLGDGESREIRVEAPSGAKLIHMVFFGNGSFDTELNVYEDTTKSHVPSAALTPINRNRRSSNISDLTICSSPSGAGNGNLLWSTRFGSDSGFPVFGSGGNLEGRNRNEIILGDGRAYLFIINSYTTNNNVYLLLDWYETEAVTED